MEAIPCTPDVEEHLCDERLFEYTRTISAEEVSAGSNEVTFELEAREANFVATGNFKVKKLLTRRLSDQRRLTSSEELTKGGWATKFDDTSSSPSGYGSEAKTETETSSKTGSTVAVAVGASALVVGAVALVAVFASRRQQQQSSELELSVALASDESAEL
jgi:hypothetical protein